MLDIFQCYRHIQRRLVVESKSHDQPARLGGKCDAATVVTLGILSNTLVITANNQDNLVSHERVEIHPSSHIPLLVQMNRDLFFHEPHVAKARY